MFLLQLYIFVHPTGADTSFGSAVCTAGVEVPQSILRFPLERENGFTSPSGTGIPYSFNQAGDCGDRDEDHASISRR